MKVPFFDRTRGDAAIEDELTAAFLRVVRSGKLILGAEVEMFEVAIARFTGARHAIAASSGSDALLIALAALSVGPGDEVVCPSYSFFATAGSIARLGAKPVFTDVDRDRLTMDPASLARAVGPRTRAIVPVHLFGLCADMRAIEAVAGSIPIVEDAAQALGSRFEESAAGARGALGCFSFFPTKNLGAFGDAGLVTTSDDALARRLRALRVHGSTSKHEHAEIGGNHRMDPLQAALLRVKLATLDDALAARAKNAARYDEALGALIARGAPLALPAAGGTYNQYVVRIGGGARDALRAFLADRGVGTEVYYPTPLHLQPALRALGYGPGDFPCAESASREALALPIFPELRADEIAYAAGQIAAFFE